MSGFSRNAVRLADGLETNEAEIKDGKLNVKSITLDSEGEKITTANRLPVNSALKDSDGSPLTFHNPLPVAFPAEYFDAFLNLKVSNPETLFDSKNIFDDPGIAAAAENQPLFYDNQQTSGAGTSTAYNNNTASQSLTVDAGTAGTRVRQTKQRFNYQPGKGISVFMTFTFSGNTNGVIQREGMFDAKNGLFLEDDNGDISLVKRSFTTGTAVDTKIARADWDDPMDGTGTSGINIDFTKTNIFYFDYEWLGVGAILFAFIIKRKIYIAHVVQNANVRETVYMSTPNLPLRSEIASDGTGTGDATITQICSTVIANGAQNPLGVTRSASTGGTQVVAATENVIYAIVGIRLKAAYIGEAIDILSIAMQLQTASHRCEWLLLFNPTVAGTFTYADETNSAVQIARGATANTVTAGIRLKGGYVESAGAPGGAAGSSEKEIKAALKLGSLIDGTVDTIVLCARPIGGSTNVQVEGLINWRELT